MQVVNIKKSDGTLEPITAYSVEDFPYEKIDDKAINCKKKTPKQYIYTFGTFDIETTTIDDGVRPYGFMYHWQICLNNIVVVGRRWEEFVSFLKRVKVQLNISKDRRLVFYVHNLAFETQFIVDIVREYLGGYKVFARGSRSPIYLLTGDGFEFRCSYILSNMSLKKACENEKGVVYPKADGDLDYRQVRTADTPLTAIELGYCVSDVVCLYDFIYNRLKNEHDNIETIPLTSTGYVRRDCRRACRKNRHYYDKFKKLEIKEDVYTLLKEAGRGGNTHANRNMSGRVWHNVDSYDAASMYPAMMCLRKFPMTAFSYYGEIEDLDEFYEQLNGYACLFRCTFLNIQLKPDVPMPYIPISKCWASDNVRLDNGRVLRGTVGITITDIDFKIIEAEYTWSGIVVEDFYRARYGMLPEELRGVVLEYFKLKCELKEAIKEAEDNGDFEKVEELSYLYAKSKNRLNGIFGMCYTDPVREVISIDDEGAWVSELPNIAEALHKYCTSRNNFVYYAWGVWVTCWARDWLEHLINATHNGKEGACIYCDTDSSKCINPDTDEIERLNNMVKKEADELGAYADVNGNRYYMGVFEHENKEPIINFKTLGAKKYCYTDAKGFHITISGVEKKRGAVEMGSINNFKPGFIFKEAGGLTLYYNDDKLHTININGCEMLTGSNIGMVESTYELGITQEYGELIGYNILLDTVEPV